MSAEVAAKASSTRRCWTRSVSALILATAVTHPAALNRISSMRPSSTLMANRILINQGLSCSIPTPSGDSSSPQLRGCRKCCITRLTGFPSLSTGYQHNKEPVSSAKRWLREFRPRSFPGRGSPASRAEHASAPHRLALAQKHDKCTRCWRSSSNVVEKLWIRTRQVHQNHIGCSTRCHLRRWRHWRTGSEVAPGQRQRRCPRSERPGKELTTGIQLPHNRCGASEDISPCQIEPLSFRRAQNA